MAGLTFRSWSQGPLGEAIGAEDGMGRLPAPELSPSVMLRRAGEEAQAVRGPRLGVLGPGDVEGLAAGSVVHCEPVPGSVQVEPNYLAYVEVTPPQLAWVLTPARPSNERLRPWFVLVVVEARTTPLTTGVPLPSISVDIAQLPDLCDSWAWAHVQEEQRITRLLCPRRLDPNTAYLACVVPAFSSGRDAGLGNSPGPDHEPAWPVSGQTTVQLPVYHHWTFETGDEGDFEELVTRLRPADTEALRVASSRPVDVRQPWLSRAALADDPQLLGVCGALVPFVDPPVIQPDVPSEVGTKLDILLRMHLDAPAAALAAAPIDDTTGSLAPPLYGARHVLRQRVEADLAWIAQLNTSVANRIAAGLGTAYVRDHQEDLMARAWEQVGAIRELNRRRGIVELSTAVAETVHAKHVASLADGEVVTFAAPASARARTSAQTTLATELTVSTMPDGVASAAFARRVRRARGTVASTVGRALTGQINVPEPRPVVPPTPVVSSTSVVEVAATAAAEQLVLMSAMMAVADVNEVGAGQLRSGLSGLGGTLASLSALGSVQPLVAELGAVADVAEVTAVTGDVLTAMSDARSPGSVTAYGVPLNAVGVVGRVSSALQPADSHYRRLESQTSMPESMARSSLGAPVLAYPEFPVPTSMALLDMDAEWFLPGLGAVPANTVALMRQNAAFIESFLVGINHEMMRELLWRGYPTDQRGTPFSRFWPRPGGASDINPLDTWTDPAPLGHRLLTDKNLAVLLVRGDVLRRYPDVEVTAQRSGPPDAHGAHRPDPHAKPLPAVFVVPVDERTRAYAFDIPESELSARATVANPGWFFVFAESGYRVRFGFDECGPDAASLSSWDHAAWPPRIADQPLGPGCVPFDGLHAVAGASFGPPTTTGDASTSLRDREARWDRDAADVARIVLQQPMRVSIQADLLLGPRQTS